MIDTPVFAAACALRLLRASVFSPLACAWLPELPDVRQATEGQGNPALFQQL
ncbi:hypothetical protein KTAU_13310 [Thermogemmatispora aurantia]|uniref:Uncharacterized protein n=1 Tax=Thermogemmatispora aurantia TaxID=2045279 RepID=A0A5J4K0W0_9CHLR|nr:hypothetical protein KTAU_13310 [Thermogemmatispora aurantia]